MLKMNVVVLVKFLNNLKNNLHRSNLLFTFEKQLKFLTMKTKKQVTFESPTYMVEWINVNNNRVKLSEVEDRSKEIFTSLDNIQFLDFNKLYAIIKNK